jgi:hypothetical protein
VNDPIVETTPGAQAPRTHARRDFLKKAAVAGVTVAYAAPIIETLQASAVAAATPSTGGICGTPGSGCYVCTITKGGFNLINSNQPCDLYNTLLQARSKFPAIDSIVGTTNNPQGTCNTTTIGQLTVLGCSTAPQTGPDLVNFMGGGKPLACNDSCGIEDLMALMLMVAANASGITLTNGCTIGLGEHACVDVSTLSSADQTAVGAVSGKASVINVLNYVISLAPTNSSAGTLCGNTALVALVQNMAQDINGSGGVYLGGSC